MTNNYPGFIDKPYYIKLNDMPFKRGDIMQVAHGYASHKLLEVLRVYRNTWFRRTLRKIGFNVRINEAKVRNF